MFSGLAPLTQVLPKIGYITPHHLAARVALGRVEAHARVRGRHVRIAIHAATLLRLQAGCSVQLAPQLRAEVLAVAEVLQELAALAQAAHDKLEATERALNVHAATRACGLAGARASGANPGRAGFHEMLAWVRPRDFGLGFRGRGRTLGEVGVELGDIA